MPDNDFDPEDFEGVTPKMATLPRADLRRMEKAAKERDAARTQLEQLQRERVFLKAGIPDTPLGALFIKGYEGEATDPEQIRAAAIEMGILQASPGQQQATAASLAGHTAAVSAQSGAAPVGSEDLVARMKAAKSSEEVARLMNEHLGQSGVTAEQMLRAQQS